MVELALGDHVDDVVGAMLGNLLPIRGRGALLGGQGGEVDWLPADEAEEVLARQGYSSGSWGPCLRPCDSSARQGLEVGVPTAGPGDAAALWWHVLVTPQRGAARDA